ncbi:uncharacterized protein [Canis lupus baileyi]|uniref:uncharacterized protein n=1 Tax=Canis lupus baileyi TaxID=143281 RepID=UPI0003ADEECD|eukprot:XP_005628726.1 uncharacterized protein LOC102151330 isoform X1 [Canis lupus familiaris]
MASFGLRSAVQPLLRPLSGGWPGSPQAGFARPSQAARGAPGAPGATCCISAQNCSSGCASGGRRGRARPELFVCSLSPESWIPWHGFSPPSGFPSCRREPFQELLGARLGCGAPAARPPQPAARASRSPDPGPRSRSRSRSAASVQQPEGGAGGAQAASGRDPSRRVAGKPGGNSFFPHSAPRGCRRRKRRRRREDRPRLGEEETLSGSASGQPEPGTPSEKNQYTRHFGAPGAPLLFFVRSHWLFQVSPCGKSRQHGACKPFCKKKFRAALGCLQGAVGGPPSEEARGEKTKKLLAFRLNHWMYLGWSCEPVV